MSILTSLFRLVPPSLRAGHCYANVQELVNDAIGGTQVTFLIQTGQFLYNYGATTPTSDNRLWPWLRTTDGRWYTFQFGMWCSPMDPSQREPSFRRMWKPAHPTPESALWSVDGGDGTDPNTVPPTATTGAAWRVDHDMDGVFPVGVGVVPGTSPAQSITLHQTGGEYEHVLTQAELPDINLDASIRSGTSDPQDPGATFLANPASSTLTPYHLLVPLGGSGTPIINMPPFRGIYWAQPTARLFYTLPA